MSESQVIARKFRPQTFNEVVGQEPITRTLVNALKNNRVHHAYLFTGARGVGKTTTARILAKALNCARGVTPEPCGVCDSCQEIAASRSIDVQEIDAATYTKVEDTREVIINTIGIAPARDRHKIFIIDEVHQLSSHSFNALLKTVEEPPPHVVFVLATTDVQKVPETILSRCQIFEFRTITLKQIVAQLRSIAQKEGVEISEAALLAIARAGEGSMRDAESALDQVISFAGSSVSHEDVSAALGLVDIETLNRTLQAIADQDAGQVVRIIDEVVSRGYDLRTFCREMMVHIRALLVVRIAGFDSELVQLPDSEADILARLAECFSEQDLLRFFSILTKTEQDIRLSSQPRFQLEIGLVKMAQARRLYLLEEAIERIHALELRLGGSPAAADRTPAPPRASAEHSTRYSTAPRVAATPGGPASSQPKPAKPQPRTPMAKSQTEAPTLAAATVAQAASPASVEASPPEPPPMDDEPYEAPPAPRPTANQDPGVARILDALKTKGKKMVLAYLDQGNISIDGDYFRVAFEVENAGNKQRIEERTSRIAIEDVCEQVMGRRLALKVSIAGQLDGAAAPTRRQTVKEAAEDNPKLRALIDKFRGEIIEVVKPES